MSVRILVGDALATLRTLPSESVQCVVSSPPYFGLRAYGTDPQIWGGDPEHDHEWGTVPSPGSRSSDTNPGPLQHAGNKGRERLTSDLCSCGAWRGELGLEPTPALFIEHLVAIFREVKRVLRPDGLVFCNLSDSYHNARTGGMPGQTVHGGEQRSKPEEQPGHRRPIAGIPQKSLMLIPQRFAIAMQDDGWIVRSQIVWAKTSAMPESVRDRPTSAWEPIWMFAKSRVYYWDQEAVREPLKQPDVKVPQGFGGHKRNGGTTYSGNPYDASQLGGANMRNVWHLGPAPLSDAHYAAFVPEIPRRCILAGTSEKGQCPACGAPWRRVVERERRPAQNGHDKFGGRGNGRANHHGQGSGEYTAIVGVQTLGWQPGCSCDDGEPRPCVVLDPFGGSGTTGLVADRLGRDAVLIELNPEYAEMARRRIDADAGPLLAEPVAVEAPRQVGLFEGVAG